jgi:transcriptional regulator with XRE-family HTH domain
VRVVFALDIGGKRSILSDRTMEPIGIALKRWREIRGLGQWDLADQSGVGYASIARIETGRQDPTVGMLARLAEALGIEVVDFFIPIKRHSKTSKRGTKEK